MPSYWPDRNSAQLWALGCMEAPFPGISFRTTRHLIEADYSRLLGPLVETGILPEEDAPFVVQGEVCQLYYQVAHPDGGRVWSIRCREDGDGKPLALVTGFLPLYGWFAVLTTQALEKVLRVF